MMPVMCNMLLKGVVKDTCTISFETCLATHCRKSVEIVAEMFLGVAGCVTLVNVSSRLA